MNLNIFDAHQDLLWYEQNKKNDEAPQTGFKMINNSTVKLVVASVFIDTENKSTAELVNLVRNELYQYRAMARQNNMIIVENRDDLARLMNSDRHGLLLHIEGADFLTPENITCLDEYYELGLRSIGLVWGKRNAVMSSSNNNGGLTDFGRKVIRRLNQRGVIIDLAHANEASFYDCLAVSTKPVMVSHGNSYDLAPLSRNFKSEQISALAKYDGVIGAFFSKKYLTTNPDTTLTDALNHIVRLFKMAPNAVMIGSDFGGITSGTPDGLEGINKYPDLFTVIEKELGVEAIENITHKNFKAFLERHFYETIS